MRRFNAFAPEFAYDDDRPAGYRSGTARIGPANGASRISATARPAVAVFPDSSKIGVWPDGDEPTLVRREPVGYWDGES